MAHIETHLFPRFPEKTTPWKTNGWHLKMDPLFQGDSY